MSASPNHSEQSAARLQIQTCICDPEQDRLLPLIQGAKKQLMSLKLLNKNSSNNNNGESSRENFGGRAKRKGKPEGLSHDH